MPTAPLQRLLLKGQIFGILLVCVLALTSDLAGHVAYAQTVTTAYRGHPDFVIHQWTSADGFPVAGVTGIHQDAEGFLWATTLAGLVRFDGVQVELFERSAYPGLSTNRLADISFLENVGILTRAESGEAILFDGFAFQNLSDSFAFRFLYGQERWDEESWLLFTDQGVLALAPEGKGEYLDDNEVVARVMQRSSDGPILIGANNGLLELHESSPLLNRLSEDGAPDSRVLSLFSTQDEVFLATAEGSGKWSERGFSEVFHIDAPGNPVDSWHVTEFDGQILFATERGWRRLQGNVLVPDFSRGTFPSYDRGIFNTVPVVDQRGDFWHAANGIVYRNDQRVLETDGTINQLHPAQSGGVWVAHNVLGLFLIQPSAVSTVGMAEQLPGENAYGVSPDRSGRMWVGLLDDRSFARFTGDGVDARIPMGTPWAVGIDPQGNTWLGGSGLCRIENTDCLLEEISGLDPAVRAIYSDSADRFWVGTQSGLWTRTTSTSPFRRIESSNPPDPWIRFIAELPSGDILFGTYGQGLGRIQADSLVFWNEQGGFPSNNIRSILSISEDEVWVGSEDIGLIVIALRQGGLEQSRRPAVIGPGQGLPDNSVHAMVKDDTGMVWVNSNRGIYRLDPANIHDFVMGDADLISTVLIDDKAGMRNREGNGGMQLAGYLDEAGHIRFPTQRGVAIINPELVGNPEPREVSILSAATPDRILEISPGPIRLASHETTLNVQFSSPHFTTSEPVSYRYRIEGQMDDWVTLGSEAQVSLNGLPKGRQRLLLQAGFSGRWSSESTVLVFDRDPAFTETIWFIVLLIGLGLTAGIGLVAGRTLSVRRRNALLEEQVRERTATIEQQALRLSELDELKSHFFSNISHELRTPLTLIKAPISNLLKQENAFRKAEALEQLDVVDRNVDRLTGLVEDILDLTAMEAGTFRLNVQMDDLEAFVQRVTTMFSAAAQDKGVELRLRSPEEPIIWTFDNRRLEHVLVNLIGNALKFTPAGGRIEVELVQNSEGEILIRVSDTGRGIPESDIPRIFDRYFQASNQSGEKGSGIGLSLCKDLVERHGGTISVSSTVGQGSTFSISLPRIDGDGDGEHDTLNLSTSASRSVQTSTASLYSNLERSEASGSKPTILIAEDNADLLHFLTVSLIRHYHILTASDGKEALELCLEVIPDLVVTDIMMPGLKGTELTEALKRELPTSHIPVVMLTALGDIDSRTDGLKTGADVYLTKPFETRELLAYIDSLLENRKRLHRVLAAAESIDESKAEESRTESTLSPMDEEFLASSRRAIQSGISNPDLTVEQLAEEVHLSARQFHRKLEAITGHAPAELVRLMRLEEATRLIGEGRKSLKEIGFAVGFKSESGFRKAFKDQYGVPPSRWSSGV